MESCWSYPDSEEYKRSKEAKALCFELVKTVQSNHLDEEIQAMVADGGTEFIEVGPGKVLQGLMRKIDKSVTENRASI